MKRNNGYILRRRRNKLKLSAAALARITGLRKATILDIENGRSNGRPATLARIDNALNLCSCS